ncbi:hypothetical protein [Breoghania sp.]|uniref:hypothetical protein n=1 Tax=Breoghania sp. TaxID=2065378 RepID=UPI002617E8CA|nr:hypothetical protein [Breoghania sp.]MDJ0933488.1 hypothetical protein [Breoghania sp.]
MMELSDANAMLNYYRACFLAPPYRVSEDVPPPVKAPTLVVHGLEDPYALPAGLNDLWHWVKADPPSAPGRASAISSSKMRRTG